MYDPLGGLLNPQPKKKDPFAGIPKAPSASKFAGIPKATTSNSLTPKSAPSFTDWMMEQAISPLKQAGEGIMNFGGGTLDVLGKTAQGDFIGALQGAGRTVGGLGQIATAPMAPAINAVRNLPQFVQDTAQVAKPSFEKTIAGAGQVGRGFQQGNVKDVVYGGAKALSGGIGTVFSPIGGMVAQLPREIQQGAGLVGQGFSALRGAAPALTGQTGTETGEFMGDVFDIGMTVLPFAGKGITKAVGKTKAGQLMKEGGQIMKQDITKGYTQNIKPNLEAIGRAVQKPAEVALTKIGELPGKARPLVGKATSGLVNQFYGIPEKAQKTIMSGNKYLKMADEGVFNEQAFLETAVKSIKDRKQALATTGKEYDAIRQSQAKAQIPEDVFASTLQKEYGLQMKNGKIIYNADTAKITLDPTTLKKLQDTYNTFKYTPGEVSINRLLNTRKGLDNMSKWDATVDYGTLGEIARNVRKKLDSYSPKELKSIDAKYAPEVQMLADVEKYLLDPKGRIKDSAESFISNLGGKGKTEQLKKLSKVIPDLQAQVDAITTLKALERAQGSYAGGSQAVKGMLTGGVLGGATAMANPLLGIPATMAGMMLSNPKIGTALLKGASKMKGKLNLPTPQTPSTTTMKQALQQSGQELSTVGRNIKSGAKSLVESQKGLKPGFIDTDLLTGKKPSTSIDQNKTIPAIGAKAKTDPLLQGAKKYKITVNIQDKNDLNYLRRILSEEQITDIKAGKMNNWRGIPYEDLARVNLISESPQTIAQQLKGKISNVKLKSDTFYHGTSANNANSILSLGFKTGKDLPAGSFKGGGYGKIQNSISLAETPKDASRFSQLTKDGKIIEVKLKPNTKTVSIKGVEDAMELEDYLPYLRKEKVDAVYIGGGEKELVVINPKSISKRTLLK